MLTELGWPGPSGALWPPLSHRPPRGVAPSSAGQDGIHTGRSQKLQFQEPPCQRPVPGLEFVQGPEMPASHTSPESRRGWRRRRAGCQAGFCKHSSRLRRSQSRDRRGMSRFCFRWGLGNGTWADSCLASFQHHHLLYHPLQYHPFLHHPILHQPLLYYFL